MWLEIFFRGLLVGFIASIPSFGAGGVLCIQRTISKSQKSGFISGLGVVTSDTFYAVIAFFSLSMVLSFIEENIMWFKIFGGICMIGIGVYIFLTNPVVQMRRNRAGKSSLWQDYISAIVITIANLPILFLFIPLFAIFGLSSETGELNAAATLVGVVAGCSLWWFLLTSILNVFRKKIRPRHLLWINRIAGIVIIILGVGALLSTIVNLDLNVIFS